MKVEVGETLACTGSYKQLCIGGVLGDSSGEISQDRLWRALCIKIGDHELYLGKWSSTLIKYAFQM